MVIIQKILSKGMDNRGSKSLNRVKEQRVDGNCSCLKYQLLRYTLMDKATCHQIKNPIEQINNLSLN